MIRITVLVNGVIAILLGGLWLLQRLGLVQIKSILYFADYACIEGGSRFWSIVGTTVFIIGIVTTGITMRQNK